MSVGFWEGPACQVRRIRFDHPSCFIGHDEHAPPIPHSDPSFRRDVLVASAESRWIIHFTTAGMTGMPLRFAYHFATQLTRHCVNEFRPGERSERDRWPHAPVKCDRRVASSPGSLRNHRGSPLRESKRGTSLGIS